LPEGGSADAAAVGRFDADTDSTELADGWGDAPASFDPFALAAVEPASSTPREPLDAGVTGSALLGG